MNTRPLLVSLLLAIPLVAAAQPPDKKQAVPKWTRAVREGKDVFATLKTNHGDVVVKLFSKDAPKTVENFVALAAGEREWTHPVTGETSRRPLYDGTRFHRVISGFMIQGGDPAGTGRGNPGYRFEDEFQSGRTFDKVGLLAMANSGPATNGSQFFITVDKTVHLNNRHTIFGEVVSGYDKALKISQLPVGPMDRPKDDVVISKVELSLKPPK